MGGQSALEQEEVGRCVNIPLSPQEYCRLSAQSREFHIFARVRAAGAGGRKGSRIFVAAKQR